jgi:hypothetical protein
VFDADLQSAIGIFGIGAIFLGRLPGGVVAQGQRLGRVLRIRLEEQHREARRPAPAPAPALVPTDLAEQVLAERGLS